ncbi:MAG: hypothetical protein ACKVQT_29105 [Burkholderiales bacterium]
MLDEDFGIAQAITPYRCLDLLVERKKALLGHVKGRWEGWENPKAAFHESWYTIAHAEFVKMSIWPD